MAKVQRRIRSCGPVSQRFLMVHATSLMSGGTESVLVELRATSHAKPRTGVPKGAKCPVLARTCFGPLLEHPHFAEQPVVRHDQSTARWGPRSVSGGASEVPNLFGRHRDAAVAQIDDCVITQDAACVALQSCAVLEYLLSRDWP